MFGLISGISAWIIPILFMFIPLYGWVKGVDVYDTFIEGAKEGIHMAVKILPYIIGMLFAISMFRVSGGFDIVVKVITPILQVFNIPGEVIPLMILRPLSGTGSLGYTTELFNSYGPDSFIGKLASTIQGSTDTTFYVLTVYFGSVGIKRFRHSLVAGLAADMAGFISALMICSLFFSG